MKVTNLIVGAGLSGLTLAERLANIKGEDVLIIERRNHIGGNVYDYDEDGILVHKYGTHIFHTNDKNVWEYLNQFTRFYPYMHEVKAFVDGQLVSVPFNLNTLFALLPRTQAKQLESLLLKHFNFGDKISILELQKLPEFAFLSEFIYKKIFLHYTLKQWQCKPNELDSSVFERVPVLIGKDNRYFNDIFQGIPMQGYTQMCKKMCENKLITLKLNCDYKHIASSIKARRVFFSGAIDEFFNYELGELPYRSLHFDFVRFEREYFQKYSVVNYPNNYDYTRIGEYKYFLDAKTPHTIISFEYPKMCQSGDERYYPVPNEQNASLYEAYLKKARALENVYFIGRLGEYKYYDMDNVISKALALFEALE